MKGGNIIKIFVNFLTTLRFVFAILLPFFKGLFSSSFFIISVAFIFFTDSVDGFLARKFNVKTLYGSLMDTIADKTLNIMLSIFLLERFKIMFLPLILEIVIAIINTSAWLFGKETKSRTLGKLKMWIVSITILIGYTCYYEILSDIFVIVGSIMSAFIQFIVIIDYIIYLTKQKGRKNQNKILKPKNLKELWHTLFDTEHYLSN